MSDITSIRSEQDYERALNEVEILWGSSSGTPKGDRLDMLATLIDAWETIQYPMASPDPMEVVKFHKEQQHKNRSG